MYVTTGVVISEVVQHGGVTVAAIVLEYLKALAWPAVALVLIFLLRDHLGGLVERIQTISTPAGGLEFAADVNQLHSAAVEAAANDVIVRRRSGPDSPSVAPSESTSLGAFEALRDVAETAAEAAILAAWRLVELQLVEAQSLVGGHHPAPEHGSRVFPITPRRWTESLVACGLDTDVADLIHDLVTLRNRAAHSVDISGISAMEYVESCAAVWVLLGRFMTGIASETRMPRPTTTAASDDAPTGSSAPGE
ncbi:hypothetical protein [Streptomyces sp. NPDC087270]|uniref:hypothetical protein n=1 Tax=Streptomyces sp. NPDC087270 TaxID=3365774 RepID=UPI003808FCBD